MQRRGFIKRLFGFATVAVVSDKLIPDKRALTYDNATMGQPFGLAPAKAEGRSLRFDPTFKTVSGSTADLGKIPAVALENQRRVTTHGVMTRTNFRAQLKP